MGTTESSKPGSTGEELDCEENVLRFGLEQSNYERVEPAAFALNSSERREDWKRISVWEKSLTTIDHAQNLLSNPKRKLLIDLNVGDVKGIEIRGKTNVLNVKWDRLPECIEEDGTKGENYDPGCEGHCALDGLYTGNKKTRKIIRKKLADLATDSNFEVLDT
ncbi:hypothetical protein [Rhodohalobacter sulfatireducens]|uniref:Uncharacterized protein n=1 Tax=Rhodohalobacter sulfatireducens TaxID=2911366 RepID=A0ABS9KE30_9BACT|nr:hypothetical protein [Rhodohalobacter sulfatireducens]MCG2589124.1 hypothetical protein [Rhodohalobacter sulfatireducens]